MASRLSPQARTAAAVGGWLTAAALATGAGMFAVGVIGAGIVPAAPQPLDAQQVEAMARSAAARPPPTGQTSTPPPSPAADPASPKVLSTAGGTVLARCEGGRVVITSASPAQGYQVDQDDDSDHGGRSTEVKFNSEETEVKVKVHCAGSVPTATVEQDGDD